VNVHLHSARRYCGRRLAVIPRPRHVALLDDLLFTEEARRPGRDRLIAKMEKPILFGITMRKESNVD
jgi:hypothetical protein